MMGAAVIADHGTVEVVSAGYEVGIQTGTLEINERYAGSYDVQPGAEPQMLPTANKLMEHDVSVAGIDVDAVDADVREGVSYFGATGLSVGSMPDNGATGGEIAARDASVAIPAGRTSGGSVSIAQAAKANLVPENVKEGVDILGVVGTFAGGGGGGGGGELLAEVPLGYVRSVNTTITQLGVTVTVPDVSRYDVLVVVTSRDSMPAPSDVSGNRHLFTATAYLLNGTSGIDAKNTRTSTGGVSAKMLDTEAVNSVYSSPANGIRGGVTKFVGNSFEIPVVVSYDYSKCGIIDGYYTTRVYGFSCLDLIGA